MNTRIEKIYCFAIIHDNGEEGFPAFQCDGLAMPMVFSDERMLDQMKPMAMEIEKMSGRKVRLYKFTEKEEIEWGSKNDWTHN